MKMLAFKVDGPSDLKHHCSWWDHLYLVRDYDFINLSIHPFVFKAKVWIKTAFLVAALHAIFYYVLTGTPTDGPESRVPQTYETTISVILSSIFTLLIHFCLGLSFTQYLWYILRRQPLTTLTIEHIFTLRSNPLSLFDRTVFRRARPLVMVAIIYWSASIAMSFPPGAITVVSSLRKVPVMNADVPTFNASDVSWL
jgi:hypothetical protein